MGKGAAKGKINRRRLREGAHDPNVLERRSSLRPRRPASSGSGCGDLECGGLRRFGCADAPRRFESIAPPSGALQIVSATYALAAAGGGWQRGGLPMNERTEAEAMYERAADPALPAVATVEGLPYPRMGGGKVRELFDLGDAYLMVATDRISAFDVVLPDPIPGKGIILTELSRSWFDRTARVVPNHLLDDQPGRRAALLGHRPELALRSLIVRKLRPLPVEAVVRGYLAGSGWKNYRQTGQLFGQAVPADLRESDRLPEAMFTPTSKAGQGQHDEPMTWAETQALLGNVIAGQVRDLSLALYTEAAAVAERAGILLADTKFEFGLGPDGEVVLIDEVLTPDSSRWWPADQYRAGGPQPSFDKQFVRDYLETLADWNKTAPGPRLPEPVINGTRRRYLEAWERLAAAAAAS